MALVPLLCVLESFFAFSSLCPLVCLAGEDCVYDGCVSDGWVCVCVCVCVLDLGVSRPQVPKYTVRKVRYLCSSHKYAKYA